MLFVTSLLVPRTVRNSEKRLRRCCITARLSVLPPTTSKAASKSSIQGKSNTSKSKRKAIDLAVDGDFLKSTLLQQVQVYGFFALAGIELFRLGASCTTSLDTIELVGGMILGWLFADFATGVYHWAVDNYGSSRTPILGRQIEAFQGHHNTPYTIARREFANNLSALTKPTTPQMIMLLALNLPVLAGGFYVAALLSIVISQEMHRQAHMAQPSPIFRQLQQLGLALPPRMHTAHHIAPYGANYCIVSGLFNPLLDQLQVFRRLEKFVYQATGNEPIAWKLDPKLKENTLQL